MKWRRPSADRVTPEPPENEALCAECGRDIFRPWINGVQEPWKHWVEPIGHPARPSGLFRVGPRR